jgi:tRNA pseudouridine55 synthase
MNGILVIDKPAGISSAGVVERVKRLLAAGKVGHAGTLDPQATGVLLCCVNQATRLARFLLEGPKTYEAVMRLGVATDTQDAGGEVIARRPVGAIAAAELEAVLRRFQGPGWQRPPAFSALKLDGVPLYRMARQGRPVQKPARRIELHRIRLLAAELPEVRFEVRCSAGTYIRTLCADIGEALGCGAHLAQLRRTECHGFTSGQALGLEALAGLAAAGRVGEALIPMAQALPGLPETVAGEALAQKVRHGHPVTRAMLADAAGGAPPPEAGFFKLLDAAGQLVAVLRAVPQSEALFYGCVFAKP